MGDCQHRRGHHEKLTENNLVRIVPRISRCRRKEDTMDKQQCRELLKTMKPMYPAPTLFGLTHRDFVLVVVAVGAVAVAVAIFK